MFLWSRGSYVLFCSPEYLIRTGVNVHRIVELPCDTAANEILRLNPYHTF